MVQKKYDIDNVQADSSQIYSIILFYGVNRGLVSERATLYARRTGIDLYNPFLTIRLEAIEIDNDPARLIDEAKTVSLFAGKRLIWIRNAGLQQKGLSKAVKWLLQDFPDHVLVIIEAGELKKNTSLRNLIELFPLGMALPCYDDEQSTIDLLINDVLEEFSLCITSDARAILHKNIGIDRLAIRSELEKLCFYAKEKQTINYDDVFQIVSDMGKSSQYEVIDSIISGNLAAFNVAFNRQTSNSHLFLILSAVQRQFQQLQELRFTMETEKKSAKSILSHIRPSIFFRRQKIIEQALSCWSVEKISHLMERLQVVVLESRKKPELAFTIVRQNLMILTYEASILQQQCSLK